MYTMYSEYVDKLLTLCECHGNVNAVRWWYAEINPSRNSPSYKTFLSTERRLQETGT